MDSLASSCHAALVSRNTTACAVFTEASRPQGVFEDDNALWWCISLRLNQDNVNEVAVYFQHTTDCTPCREAYLQRQIVYHTTMSALEPVSRDLLTVSALFPWQPEPIEEPQVEQKRERSESPSPELSVKKSKAASRYYIQPNKWCDEFGPILRDPKSKLDCKNRRGLFKSVLGLVSIEQKPTIETTSKHFDTCLDCCRLMLLRIMKPKALEANQKLHDAIYPLLSGLRPSYSRNAAVQRIAEGLREEVDENDNEDEDEEEYEQGPVIKIDDRAVRYHMTLCDGEDGCNAIWRERYQKPPVD